jgi:putative intracellular protease/amidase
MNLGSEWLVVFPELSCQFPKGWLGRVGRRRSSPATAGQLAAELGGVRASCLAVRIAATDASAARSTSPSCTWSRFRPLQLSDVRLEDYDAVYLPGGHGPMSDLAWDADCGRLLTAQLASGNPLFIVCHGPAAMLATRIHGISPFKGYRVTCFTNEEEEAVGLAPSAPWLLETDLKEKVGVEFSRGPIWEPYMVEDRNLVTGQNPHSAAVLGDRMLEILARADDLVRS